MISMWQTCWSSKIQLESISASVYFKPQRRGIIEEKCVDTFIYIVLIIMIRLPKKQAY